MDRLLPHVLSATVTLAAGVIVGAMGVYLYKSKRRLVLQQDVIRLNQSLNELRSQVEELKARYEASNNRRRRRRKPADLESTAYSEQAGYLTADNLSEMMSVANEDDDEFFDFSEYEDEVDEDVPAKFKTIDSIMVSNEDNKLVAYEMLNDLLAEDSEDLDTLWRLAKVSWQIAKKHELLNDKNEQKEYIDKGIDYATKCLRIHPRSALSHKWYAICVGAKSEIQSTKDKIKSGCEFKEHVEEALKIDPEDPTLHHLLGRYQFEVSRLSWIERQAAKTLFGEIPQSSFSEAAESLSKAEELSQTPWKENMVLLAKCYIELGDTEKALEWLEKAEKIESVSKEDKNADEEIQKLIKSHGHSRSVL